MAFKTQPKTRSLCAVETTCGNGSGSQCPYQCPYSRTIIPTNVNGTWGCPRYMGGHYYIYETQFLMVIICIY